MRFLVFVYFLKAGLNESVQDQAADEGPETLQANPASGKHLRDRESLFFDSALSVGLEDLVAGCRFGRAAAFHL